MESPQRIEPCRLERFSDELADVVAELAGTAARLERSLPTASAQSLADLVRITNCYYSNLIEGHDTRPRDIEQALANELADDEARRNLQFEARAHVRLQQRIDIEFERGELPDPVSPAFVKRLHEEFYDGATPAMLRVETTRGTMEMIPGRFRSLPEHDNAVGRHVPPSSTVVSELMDYFAERFRRRELGAATRIVNVAIAHHRFNYIHPFPDGNGRVSRLMSHAMALDAGIGAHGLWSISRGLARGLRDRSEYKLQMDAADEPRRSDLDGRGNLSLEALESFVVWFCRVMLDQIRFMTTMFDFPTLPARLGTYVQRDLGQPAEAATLAREVLRRGEIARGEAPGIIGAGERKGRTVLSRLVETGLVASNTPKGPVSLRFGLDEADVLFPRLF